MGNESSLGVSNKAISLLLSIPFAQKIQHYSLQIESTYTLFHLKGIIQLVESERNYYLLIVGNQAGVKQQKEKCS